MISTIRLPENGDSKACNSILKIGHLLVSNFVSKNNTVRTPKYRSDDKDHKTEEKRGLSNVSQFVQFGHIFGRNGFE